MKSLRFYSDPGHGWLAVKFALLVDLGLVFKISAYSYHKGNTVYLEEDSDCSIFIEAYIGKYGSKPTIKEASTNRTSRIRSYAAYNPVQLAVKGNLQAKEYILRLGR